MHVISPGDRTDLPGRGEAGHTALLAAAICPGTPLLRWVGSLDCALVVAAWFDRLLRTQEGILPVPPHAIKLG